LTAERWALGVVRVGDDQLVGRVLLQYRAQVVELTELWQRPRRLGRPAHHAQEVVLDAAADGAERAQEVVEVIALAHDDRAASHAEDVERLTADRVVARPQEPVQHDREHE
jgi:hypothetical protein